MSTRILINGLRASACLALALTTACSGGDDRGDDDTTIGIRDGGTPVRDGGPEPECSTNAECSGATPFCNDLGECAAPPPGSEIGYGDQTALSVDFVVVHEPTLAVQSTDLEFHPMRTNELWVLHRQPKSNSACTQQVREGCASLEGSTTTISNVGEPNQTAEWKRDGNAWHFMRRPPALAFSADNGNFATCGEEWTGNFLPVPRPANEATFIGPSLWSSDPAVYAITPPGGNGSHLDMLHETPYGMGIAWERGNAFWVFNGEVGSLDRYDFKNDHGPGNDDHSDGELLRYAEGTVSRVEGVPSHMAYDPGSGLLYVADTGNSRIIALDTTSGSRGGNINPVWEPLADQAMMNSATVMEIVPPGLLDRPSGLELHNDLLYVTDTAQSRFYVFDLQGNEVNRLQTGLPAGELGGIAFGPDGNLYFALMTMGDVYRIAPR